jgi:hypothetical protein
MAAPCPNCGSQEREIEDCDSGTQTEGDHLEAVLLRAGLPIAFDESRRSTFTRFGTITSDNSILLNLWGEPPRNEDDSSEVTGAFLDYLRNEGRSASAQTTGTGDTDYTFILDGNSAHVQVVRAMTDPQFWRTLFADKEITAFKLSYSEAAFAIRQAIFHKTRPVAIPLYHRHTLFLLLDAFRLPALAFGPVIAAFRETHGAWAKDLGFRSIYVVGPDARFVQRLDAVAV